MANGEWNDETRNELQSKMERLRQERQIRDDTPIPDSVDAMAGRVMRKVRELPQIDQESLAEKRQKIRDSQEHRAIVANLTRLESEIGKRYAGCRFGNFKLSADQKHRASQQAVLDRLRSFCDDLPARVSSGEGLVLFGPPGTGKDHLLVAPMRAACIEGFTVRWISGADLFGAVRDTFGDKPHRTERDVLQEFCAPNVLAISDPVPPAGSLNEFQSSWLWRLADARYRAVRPTWLTANFSNGDEARNRIGSATVDRLQHGSTVLFCNWPSYRGIAE